MSYCGGKLSRRELIGRWDERVENNELGGTGTGVAGRKRDAKLVEEDHLRSPGSRQVHGGKVKYLRK